MNVHKAVDLSARQAFQLRGESRPSGIIEVVVDHHQVNVTVMVSFAPGNRPEQQHAPSSRIGYHLGSPLCLRQGRNKTRVNNSHRIRSVLCAAKRQT